MKTFYFVADLDCFSMEGDNGERARERLYRYEIAVEDYDRESAEANLPSVAVMEIGDRPNFLDWPLDAVEVVRVHSVKSGPAIFS